MRHLSARAFGSFALTLASISCHSAQPTSRTAPPPHTAEAERAIPFGYKTIWLAVRSDEPRAVVEALGGRSRRATWKEGLADGSHLFVTPPIDGWVLVTGNLEAADTSDVDSRLAFSTALSTRLETEVQYFGTHRIVEWHAWARIVRGEVVRAHGYVGESNETLFDVGAATPDELALGFKFLNNEGPETRPDERDVTRLAGRWSIDPTTLGERAAVGDGWIVER